MSTNKGIYNDTKQALWQTLVDGWNATDVRLDVYKAPFQNIERFPCITIEAVSRKKVPKGLGVSQYEIAYYVWVYTDVMDSYEAEENCLEYTRETELILLDDKTLGGVSSYLSLNEDEIQFGVIEQGENNFLQGARIPVTIITKAIPDKRT